MAQRNISGMSDEELFQSWAEWITRTADELVDVFHNRQVFLHIKTMFDTNPPIQTDSGHWVLDWLARLYGHDALMFIRREFDTQNGTINLLHLLSEIESRSTVLSRWRYRRFFDDAPVPEACKDDLADHYFDKLTLQRMTNRSDDHLSAEQPRNDRLALGDQIKSVLDFAQRMLAHRTPPPSESPPPIRVPDDLDPPLNAVRLTFNRYYPLLTGKSMPHPAPTIQFDWTQCFRHPWATDEYFRTRHEQVRARARFSGWARVRSWCPRLISSRVVQKHPGATKPYFHL